MSATIIPIYLMVGGCENEETATTTQSLNRNFGLIILFQLQRYQRITKVTRVEGSGRIEINYPFKFDIISINLHFRGVIRTNKRSTLDEPK